MPGRNAGRCFTVPRRTAPQISLRTLTALEWVKKDAAGVYSTTAEVVACAEAPLIDEFCEDVYGGKGALLPRLAKWLPSVTDGWSRLPAAAAQVPMLHKLFCGAVIAPTMLELRGPNAVNQVGESGDVVLTKESAAVGSFFASQGWGTFDAPKLRLTLAESGHFFVERSAVSRAFGTTA